MSWRNSVNQTVGVARISDINHYVRVETPRAEAPIDIFYRSSQDLLRVGTPPFLSANPAMGPLLLVGLVSATENFFRDALARIIQICPIAKAASADQSIKLGSVVWHGAIDVERGAFDHISFADVDNVVSSSKKFIGYQIQKSGILKEFEKICELRHSVVHSGAVIAGKNAIRLQIPATSGALRVGIGFAELQEAGDVCTTLVASVNTELFNEMARRWAVEWPKLPSWDSTQRHARFRALWEIFYSTRDAMNGSIPMRLSLMKCKNRVAAEFT